MTTQTREHLIAAIDGITAQMKGPLSYLERMLLHEDRNDLREELAKIDAREKRQ